MLLFAAEQVANLQKELDVMRFLAAEPHAIQKVKDEFGPLSLWTKSAFDKHVADAIKAERERYAPLDIYEPNAEVKTQCIIRWMAETPSGWIGAWDKAALENVCITAAAIEKGLT